MVDAGIEDTATINFAFDPYYLLYYYLLFSM